MNFERHLPLRRWFSLIALGALAMVLSLSLAACAEETEIEDEFDQDTTLLDTPAYDTTMFDTMRIDTMDTLMDEMDGM